MTDVEIANIALGLIGRKGITTFDDECAEARLAKTLFANARDAVLEDRLWSFAVARFILNPDVDAPDFGYAHSFSLPGEVVRVHRVDDGSGSYDVDFAKEGRKLLSDAEKLYVIAIANDVGTDTYSPNFCLAVAHKLASLMAIPLTQNATLQKSMVLLYEAELRNAAGTDGSQGKNEQVKVSWVRRVRGG